MILHLGLAPWDSILVILSDLPPLFLLGIGGISLQDRDLHSLSLCYWSDDIHLRTTDQDNRSLPLLRNGPRNVNSNFPRYYPLCKYSTCVLGLHRYEPKIFSIPITRERAVVSQPCNTCPTAFVTRTMFPQCFSWMSNLGEVLRLESN